MQVEVREGFVTLPLRCAQCQKSNDSKSSYVLWRVVHKFFHSLRGKMFRTSCGGKFRVSSLEFLVPSTHKILNSELGTRNSELLFSTFVPLRDHFVSSTQHRARARTVCLSDQSFAFHDVENRSGAAIADAQTALQDRRRGSLHLYANPECLFKKLVVFAAAFFEAKRFLLGLGDCLVIFRFCLGFGVGDYLADLSFVNVGPVHPD